MRFLTAQQQELAGRRNLDVVPIVIITTYTDRTAAGSTEQEDRRFWTQQAQFAFSDISFPIGNLDVQPYLVSMSPYAQSVNATPEDSTVGSGLYRNFRLTLRNGITDNGDRLISDLLAVNINGADVAVGQIALDRRTGETEYDAIRRANLGDLAVFYRGVVQQVGPITNDAVNLLCNSHTPRGALGRFVITEGTANTFLGDIRSTSTMVPTVYGNKIQKAPGIIWSSGFQTTLSEPIDALSTEILLSDIPDLSITPQTGSLYVAGELMTYGAITGPVVTGLVRDPDIAAEHLAAETVSFVPVDTTFVTAVNAVDRDLPRYASAGNVGNQIRNFYFRNPATNELMEQAESVGQTSSAPGNTPALGLGYANYEDSSGDGSWLNLVDEMTTSALVSQQAVYGSIPTTLTGFGVHDNDATSVSDQALADDGIWQQLSTDTPVFTYDEGEAKRKVQRVVAASDIPSPTDTATEIFIKLIVEVLAVPAGTTAAQLEGSLPTPFGTLTATSDTTELLTLGFHTITGDPIPADAVTTVLDIFEGQTFTAYFVRNSIVATSAGYQANIEMDISYERVDGPTDTPQVTPAAIVAAAAGVSVESYFDIRRDISFLEDSGWDYPGLSLHRQDGVLVSNCTVETNSTAWAPFLHVEATVSTGDAVFQFNPTSGSLDMSDGSIDPSSAADAWLGRIVTNPGGMALEMLVSDELITDFSLPTDYRTYFENFFPDGEYRTVFDSQVDTGTPVLSNIRTIRITIKGLTVAGTIMDVWWMGPRRAFANVFKGSTNWPDEINHPVDILRDFLVLGCRQLTPSIDESSFDLVYTNLGTTKEAQVLSSDYRVGADHVRFLLAFGRDQRLQIVSTETDSNTVWRVFAADTSYQWGSPTCTLSLFTDMEEVGVDNAGIYTRRTFGYNPDRSISGSSSATWKGAYLVSADQNDIPGSVTTQDIVDKEEAIGERIGPDMFLPSVVDDASAEDIAGYYFNEDLVGRSVFRITGIPWVEGYDLELNDVIDVIPPWYTAAVTLRVIETVKNWRTELVDIVGAEL